MCLLQLAFSVLRDYDPIAEQKKTQADDKSPPVLPLFECSKVVTATLPGETRMNVCVHVHA